MVGRRGLVLHPVVMGLAISTVVGLLLGITGPFGSYLNGTPMMRIAYWVVCLWSGWLIFGVSLPMLTRLAARHGVRAWLWMPPAIAVLTILPAVLSRAAAVRLWPVVQGVNWIEWYGQGLVISAVLTLAMTWLTRPREQAVAVISDSESADPRNRLPARLGRDVQCLQMEDHYVRVHTSLGSALVLMSLSQAMAGLKDIEGLQTHRSW